MEKRVLLIDDDKICNFITEATLNRLGIAREITAALNGKEALQLINDYFTGSRTIPDIILLDLNMPIMDGFQFLEAFKKLENPKKEKVLIIVLTSSENPDDIVKVKKLGIDHFMTKPLNEEKLIAILKE